MRSLLISYILGDECIYGTERVDEESLEGEEEETCRKTRRHGR